MNEGMKLVVFPVDDLDRAKTLYRALLGVDPYADSPYYVGYRTGDLEIGLDPNGRAKGQTGPIPYWWVDDIRASLQTLQAAGATVKQDVTDVGGGLQIAVVQDADGNPLGLRQA